MLLIASIYAVCVAFDLSMLYFVTKSNNRGKEVKVEKDEEDIQTEIFYTMVGKREIGGGARELIYFVFCFEFEFFFVFISLKKYINYCKWVMTDTFGLLDLLIQTHFKKPAL